MTLEGWLNAIPVIPLEPGCPVLRADGPDKGAGAIYVGRNDVFIHIIWDGEAEREAYYPEDFVPDLTTNIGFGVALRSLTAGGPASVGAPAPALIGRHFRGTTTDADRFALAKAMREVSDE